MPTIPINEIVISARIRQDVRNVPALAESIRQHGLMQPPGIDGNKNLVWGFRRLSACRLLGWTEIPYVDAKVVPEDERAEMEFAENNDREDFTWQEECLGMLDIYKKKRQRGAVEGWTWGQRQACDLFGMQIGTVNYVLRVAAKLKDESDRSIPMHERKYWNYSSANEAYRNGILGEEQDRINADIARTAQENASKVKQKAFEDVEKFKIEIDSAPMQKDFVDVEREHVLALRAKAKLDYLALSEVEARSLYLSNPMNPPEEFSLYWNEKRERIFETLTVDLSSNFFNTDCIAFMNARPGMFDHIITDIPYGIEMKMLSQLNQHGGMTDIDRVEATHDVADNMSLMAKFFPATFACTKDHSFVVTCCDLMQWQYMYDLAIKAGFAVQRWPYVWRKVNQSLMNNCAGFNTTKDYESVMICRKPGATLAAKRNTSFTDASNNEVVKLTGHPFAKPFELTKDLVDMVSLPNQLILDPFCGAGSMVLQFLRSQRRAMGCELEPHWYNQLLTNLKEHHYLTQNPNYRFK